MMNLGKTNPGITSSVKGCFFQRALSDSTSFSFNADSPLDSHALTCSCVLLVQFETNSLNLASSPDTISDHIFCDTIYRFLCTTLLKLNQLVL